MSRVENCPICLLAIENIERISGRDAYEIVCPRCGTYGLTGSLIATLPSDPEAEGLRPYLSAYSRQSSRSHTNVMLTTENWRGLAEGHSQSSVGQKLRKLLEYIGDCSGRRAGTQVAVDADRDYPLFNAADPTELRWLNGTLAERGLIEISQEDNSATLTVKGWEAYRPSSAAGVPGSCFVAMAFDPALDDCFERGIRPSIEQDCGFTVIRVDKVEHNENINDKILAEIRTCQFLVADFTHHRNGVYFEAGFALGLGKPVIWVCRKDHFVTTHFDTRPYNHILWETPEELRERLTYRIKATIPIGQPGGSL